MDLVRANKLTVYHSGDHVMTGIFYKTNKKLITIDSDDNKTKLFGYVEPQGIDAGNPEGLEAVEVTPQQKLDSFREFLIMHSTAFGIIYDPIDRRPESEKYPDAYDTNILKETASKMVTEVLTHIVNVAQEKTINRYIENLYLPKGTKIQCIVDTDNITVDVQELYKNGNIKYGTASFPIEFGLTSTGKVEKTMIDVQLISGQIKKPRTMGQFVLTAHGLKTLLTDADILPRLVDKTSNEEGGEDEDNS